jgi:hypothetical protein
MYITFSSYWENVVQFQIVHSLQWIPDAQTRLLTRSIISSYDLKTLKIHPSRKSDKQSKNIYLAY